jgi:lipoprotein-anchoring transpeptidase ErfK/SrfK
MRRTPRSACFTAIQIIPACLAAVLALGASASAASGEERIGLEKVNGAAFAPLPPGISAVALKAAILLDRAGFSVGAIDGTAGEMFRKALAAFQAREELTPSGELDRPTWDALTASSDEPVLKEYDITPADTRGPFLGTLPERLEDQARLKQLSYATPREMLAERFHMAESLLATLNHEATFDQPGTRILVAQVGRKRQPARARVRGPGGSGAVRGRTAPKVARIEVDKAERSLRAFDDAGTLVAFYPVSIGSDEKLSPSGTFAIRRIARGPVFEYNPRYAFKEVATPRRFSIAAGPNSPVGTVWIDFRLHSYGIHGTPEPEAVGKAASHGCVRMTNWDVEDLASLVAKGTVVSFIDPRMPATASVP